MDGDLQNCGRKRRCSRTACDADPTGVFPPDGKSTDMVVARLRIAIAQAEHVIETTSCNIAAILQLKAQQIRCGGAYFLTV